MTYEFLGSAASLLRSEREAQVRAVSAVSAELGTREPGARRGGSPPRRGGVSPGSCSCLTVPACRGRENLWLHLTLCSYWVFLVIYSYSDSGGA